MISTKEKNKATKLKIMGEKILFWMRWSERALVKRKLEQKPEEVREEARYLSREKAFLCLVTQVKETNIVEFTVSEKHQGSQHGWEQ